MGQILLGTIICAIVITALARPWVGVSSYYLLSILGPQYIWWWNFQGLRVSLIVALCSLAGVALQLVKRNYDLNFLLNRQNILLAMLWLAVSVSYLLGPYVPLSASPGLQPEQLFSITNTIFIFYFCSALEINDVRKLRYLVLVFAVSTLYLIYWGNSQYFSQNWGQFNMGRLMGPRSIDGGSIYADENSFAMLFVTGIPFIFCLGLEMKNKLWRYLLWAVIPLGLHVVFLTGSRGGLVGLVMVALVAMALSNRKRFAIPLLLSLLFFYQWQAGDTMKNRSDTIVNYEGESSAETRIVAWKGGLRMMAEHPIVGVGLGTFVTALPSYIESKPMVAHNTFIQFLAESGVVAGGAYLTIVMIFFLNSKKIRSWCREHEGVNGVTQITRYNNASTVSFAGLIVCSLFLSLNTYEIFFVLLLFNNCLSQTCWRLAAQRERFGLLPAV